MIIFLLHAKPNKDHEYKRKLEDYRRLCHKCHHRYDVKMGLRKQIGGNLYGLKKGHSPWNKELEGSTKNRKRDSHGRFL